MKKDNRGFSIVELIIVIAMMVILIGVMAASISNIFGYRAKECRSKVMTSLDNGRLMTLSKSRGGTCLLDTNTYLAFVQNDADGCNYCLTVIEGEIFEVKKISKPKVTLCYSITPDATSGTPIASIDLGTKNLSLQTDPGILETARAAATKIAYNRQTGAFLPSDQAGTIYVYHFFALAGRYSYGISLHPKTGKVESGERTRAESL